MEGPPITPRIRDLIREGARIALNAPEEWLDELDNSVAATNPAVARDPELEAASKRTNRANLTYWASANVQSPGEPVPGNRGSEPMAIARDLVRRGMDLQTLDAYRVGQSVAWRFWMKLAFSLTDDVDELEVLLDVTARSINDFVEDTMRAIREQMLREREDLTSGSHAERREVVGLLLEGAPISRARAEQQLGYRLDRAHVASIVWCATADAAQQQLDAVSEAIARTPDTVSLSVVASTATRWVWVSGAASGIDHRAVEHVLCAHPSVRVAIGPLARGVDGFTRSHLDALTTQRMMNRLRSSQQVATFDEVEFVALLSTDTERAEAFVEHTLGDLANADERIRRSVSALVDHQHNVSTAAEALFIHRNTLIRHVGRAESLLPPGRSLRTHSSRIAAALEYVRWRA